MENCFTKFLVGLINYQKVTHPSLFAFPPSCLMGMGNLSIIDKTFKKCRKILFKLCDEIVVKRGIAWWYLNCQIVSYLFFLLFFRNYGNLY